MKVLKEKKKVEIIKIITYSSSVIDCSVKKTNLIFSFNQHIPLKIKENNVVLPGNSQSNSSNIEYGGGKFQILISRGI